MTSSPLAFLRKGSFAVPSFILLKAFTIMNTTQATMRKLMIALMKAPKSMPFSNAGHGDIRPETSVPAPPVMKLDERVDDWVVSQRRD